jgi:hypothetical protein
MPVPCAQRKFRVRWRKELTARHPTVIAFSLVRSSKTMFPQW